MKLKIDETIKSPIYADFVFPANSVFPALRVSRIQCPGDDEFRLPDYSVFPAKAGIQSFRWYLDPGFRRGDYTLPGVTILYPG